MTKLLAVPPVTEKLVVPGGAEAAYRALGSQLIAQASGQESGAGGRVVRLVRPQR